MVAIRALHAERKRRLRGRRPARQEPGTQAAGPDPVSITRATVIAAASFPDGGAAADWLRRCSDREAAADAVEEALEHVNCAVSAHRVAAQDHRVRDLVAADVQRVRLGYGSGDDVVEGSWREAVVISPEHAQRKSRRRMLSPQEEMAGMLSGRRPAALASEELILRARLDLDHGRMIEAALVARAAAEAFAAELAAGERDSAGARAQHQSATALAQAALARDLSPGEIEELAEVVTALERAARRRRYADDA